MYSACAHSFYYEDGDETKTDAWCHLFQYEDLKVNINFKKMCMIFILNNNLFNTLLGF